MVHRIVVIGGLGVAALAIAAVVLLMVVGTPQQPSEEPTAESVDREAPSVAEVDMPKGPAERSQPRRQPASAVAEPTQAESESTEPQQAEIDPTILATSDPDAFVRGLSDKQNSELYRLLREKQGERAMREDRYNLLTDRRLMMMGFGNRKLTLTEEQKVQIADIKKAYRPQMEAALGDLWARQEEANRKIRDAYQGAKTVQDYVTIREQNQALLQEMQDITKQISEASKPLDEQYQADIRSVLTPEQVKELDETTARWEGGGLITTRKTDGGSTQVIVGGSGGGGGGPVIIQPDSGAGK